MRAVNPLLATGVAPHSLGEVFVKRHLKARPNASIIGIDRISNKLLERLSAYSGITFDLNPLNFKSGLKGFEEALRSALLERLNQLHGSGFQCLIQFAGVYDFGPFLDHDVNRRERILGVNFVGHVEVLHNVMAVNNSRGIDNTKELTYIDIGSFQGLYARAERPIYAPSKAAGIDFCTALNEGREVKRCIYFAPGPIDTHMLHRNHWVTKSQGSAEFFQRIFQANAEIYRAIFIDCDESVFRREASAYTFELDKLLEVFEKYCSIRLESFEKEPGILRPEDCASTLSNLITQPDLYRSDVYLACAISGRGTLRMMEFSDLSRLDVFEREGRPVPKASARRKKPRNRRVHPH